MRIIIEEIVSCELDVPDDCNIADFISNKVLLASDCAYEMKHRKLYNWEEEILPTWNTVSIDYERI